MDWDLIPGTTVDYNGTPTPECGSVDQSGVEAFVGGASDSKVGIAAMRYTNPVTKSFGFQKAVFFAEDDIQHVMVSMISRNGSAPVYSVLDQKRRRGKVIVDDAEIPYPASLASLRRKTLWHDNVGYTFTDLGRNAGLSIFTGKKTGDWSMIGTSTQPPTEVDFFTAWIQHTNLSTPLSYTTFPGVSYQDFRKKRASAKLRTLQNNNAVSAIYHEDQKMVMVVFWSPAGGSVTFNPNHGHGNAIRVSSSGNAAVILRIQMKTVTVSDPSQSLSSVTITIKEGNKTKTVPFILPTGGSLGQSVTKRFN